MPLSCNVLGAMIVCLAVSSNLFGAPAARPLHVTITPSSKDCLLGEPLGVHVTVTNVGTQLVDVWSDEFSHAIRIHIAREGKEFRPFVPYTVGYESGGQRTAEPLQAGASKTYALRVLYAFVGRDTLDKQSRLAFERPGKYSIKAVYPVPGPGERKIESNLVEIDVRQPEGVEAEVWREIKHRHFLYFLQHRQCLCIWDDTPSRVAELLQQYPNSRYSKHLKEALREYYDGERKKMTKERAFDDLQMLHIRAALGIVEAPPELWRGDRHLDVIVSYSSTEPVSLDKVCAALSRQTGLSLHVAPELREKELMPQATRVPLRKLMEGIGQIVQGKWIHQEDGTYLLTPRGPDPK